MKYVEFGESGRKVSVIGIGCMRISEMDEDQVWKLVETALENGVNFFDHADIYGNGKSESLFGSVLQKNPSLRQKMFIQSKCAIHDGQYDFSGGHIIRSVDRILERLKTDYIDSLLLHRPDPLMDVLEVSEAVESLKKSGKILDFGVSNMNRFQMELLSSALAVPISANQVQMSLAHCPLIDEGVCFNTVSDGSVVRGSGTLEYCRMKKIAVQAWSPLQKGFFQGVFLDNPEYGGLNGELSRLSEKYGVPKDAVAYAWLLRYPAKMQVVLGTTRPERIASGARASDVELSREDWYALYRAAGHWLP